MNSRASQVSKIGYTFSVDTLRTTYHISACTGIFYCKIEEFTRKIASSEEEENN